MNPGSDETAELLGRLRMLGLRDVRRLELHRNRVVLLTLQRGVLRIHRGYLAAPDDVLQAVVRFLSRSVPRRERLAARRRFLEFPVDAHAPSRPRVASVRVRPEDRPWLDRLRDAHERLNREHFGGTLSAIPIRISGRMRTRLGEVTLSRETGAAVEIAMSRAHLRHESWLDVEHTLLHEMVHQWQAETGRAVDHGPEFRRKAREVGIVPRARRPDIMLQSRIL